MKHTGIGQDELLAFLEAPASYPYSPDRVEIIQTHISYVAIAPPYVYKVKKPVELGFLDFSTLEKRKYYCEEEVRLNRRLCRDIYEGVVSLSRTADGALTWGEGEAVVEYAVKMKHLAAGGFLDQRLDRGAVTLEDLERVVERLRSFYEARQPSAEIAEWGRIARLRISTDENFEQTGSYVGSLLSRPAFEALRFYTDRFYDCHAALLHQRRAEGHILDGHGDLHLEHVHLTPERVCIYDCIEFNERLRYIDVANDVAFLVMDLDYHDHPELARYVARRMAEALDDPDLLTVMDFYACYRAYVRGKVESMRSEEAEVPTQERQASRASARRHYQLALRYAVAGSEPLVVVVMGRVGTGKSTQARTLGDALGWPVVASDRVRKEMAGVPLDERGDEATRSRLYAQDMTTRTYAALHDQALRRARKGRSTVLDATYSRPQHRAALRTMLQQHDIRYAFVEVTASDETIRARLRRREQAPEVISDARLEDFEMLAARYEAPDGLEDARHLTASSEMDPAATTLDILKQLICLAD